MQIIPPRRPGSLGAISLGPGAQVFNVQPGTGSSGTRAASDTPAPKGSVAPVPAKSVSEQVQELRVASAQKAAAVVKPSGQADVYRNPPTAYVQSYAPPKGTPAVTAPPKQPNESAVVRALANQVPQTKAQAVQKVLAQQAGLAVAIPNQPPIVLQKNPPLPRPPPIPPVKPVTNPVVSPGITPPRAMPAVPSAPGGVYSVNATTASNIPPGPYVNPPLPKPSPQSARAALVAASAQEKADVKKADAVTAATTAKIAESAALKASMAHKASLTEAAARREAAKQAVVKLESARAQTMQILTSQTASEDAKAKAQSDLRDAQAEAQVLVKASQEADVKVQKAAEVKIEAAETAKSAVNEAQKASGEAADATAAAGSAIKEFTAVAEKPQGLDMGSIQKASTEELTGLLAAAEAGTSFKDLRPMEVAAAVPAIKAELARRNAAAAPTSTALAPIDSQGPLTSSRQFATMAPPKPAEEEKGVSATTILLGLVAVGAIAYALSPKKTGFSGAPTLIESLE